MAGVQGVGVRNKSHGVMRWEGGAVQACTARNKHMVQRTVTRGGVTYPFRM